MPPMSEISYRGRRAVQIENDLLRATTTIEGGHVAEILHKPSGVNPLWTPPWPSIEPSTYRPSKHPEYGASNEAHLLSGFWVIVSAWIFLARPAPTKPPPVFPFTARLPSLLTRSRLLPMS